MGYLISETTKEEREKIVAESLGNIDAACDGCMSGLVEMYQDYIDGKKELREINMEFNARYVNFTKIKAVFIGTSNDPNPLTDATGNRRYSVLYVRSMGGDLATAKKVRDSIDIQQLWAQVYENYHSLSKDVSELVSMVVQKSQEINTKYGMRESAEESLVTQLRPVDWDVDTDTTITLFGFD